MKKYVSFALVVCLLVLAVAVVLGVTYPSVRQWVVDCLDGLLQRVKIIFEHLWEGLNLAFAKQ